MVAGDKPPPGGHPGEPEAGLAAAPVSNGVVAVWLKPVVACGDEDFFAVSDCSASNAVESAPRAGNMTKLHKCRAGAAHNSTRKFVSKHRAMPKNPVKQRFFVAPARLAPGN